MKDKQDEIIKNIIKENKDSISSEGFNERVIGSFLSKKGKILLRPDFNHSLLIFLLSIAVIFFVVILRSDDLLPDLFKISNTAIVNLENILPKVLLVTLVFILYTFLCDLLEEKIFKETV